MPEMRPSRGSTSGRTTGLPEIFETSQVESKMKAGPAAAAERMNRKNVEGQMANPFRHAKPPPRSTPYNRPSDPWGKNDRNVPTPASTGISLCNSNSKIKNDGIWRSLRSHGLIHRIRVAQTDA